MLFWITVGSERIAIQAVNRKPNPYWRLAPFTLVYPTPRQRAVRYTLAEASHASVDQSVATLNTAVQDAFVDWEKTPRAENKIQSVLRNLYGDEADKVLDYISTRRRLSQKLIDNPELHEQITKEFEKMMQKYF